MVNSIDEYLKQNDNHRRRHHHLSMANNIISSLTNNHENENEKHSIHDEFIHSLIRFDISIIVKPRWIDDDDDGIQEFFFLSFFGS